MHIRLVCILEGLRPATFTKLSVTAVGSCQHTDTMEVCEDRGALDTHTFQQQHVGRPWEHPAPLSTPPASHAHGGAWRWRLNGDTIHEKVNATTGPYCSGGCGNACQDSSKDYRGDGNNCSSSNGESSAGCGMMTNYDGMNYADWGVKEMEDGNTANRHRKLDKWQHRHHDQFQQQLQHQRLLRQQQQYYYQQQEPPNRSRVNWPHIRPLRNTNNQAAAAHRPCSLQTPARGIGKRKWQERQQHIQDGEEGEVLPLVKRLRVSVSAVGSLLAECSIGGQKAAAHMTVANVFALTTQAKLQGNASTQLWPDEHQCSQLWRTNSNNVFTGRKATSSIMATDHSGFKIINNSSESIGTIIHGQDLTPVPTSNDRNSTNVHNNYISMISSDDKVGITTTVATITPTIATEHTSSDRNSVTSTSQSHGSAQLQELGTNHDQRITNNKQMPSDNDTDSQDRDSQETQNFAVTPPPAADSDNNSNNMNNKRCVEDATTAGDLVETGQATKRVRKLKRGLKLCSNITCYIEQVLYNC